MSELEKRLEEKRHAHAKLFTEAQRNLEKQSGDGTLDKEAEALYAKHDEDLSALEAEMQDLRTKIERDNRMNTRRELELEADAKFMRDDPGEFSKKSEAEALQARAWENYLKMGEKLPMDQRAVLAGDQISAGYLTPPNQVARGIIKAADDAHVIRQLAFTQTVPESVDLGVINLNTDVSDFSWTTEVKEPTEASDPEFGQRHFVPHPAEQLRKYSAQFIRSASAGVEFINGRVVYHMGNTQENAFMTGDGSKKPLGIFTQSADGIPSTRYVSTGNTQTQIKADNLLEAQGNQKDAYMSKWLFHRNVLTHIRKLKDGNGQFIFRPGLEMGAYPTLLGEQYILSEFAPKTFTAGLPVYAYGDYSYYWIVDSLKMHFQVFAEKYAPKYIGYYWMFATDGQPVLGEAFTIGSLAP
jgi:HK97 family phage major capsid protein